MTLPKVDYRDDAIDSQNSSSRHSDTDIAAAAAHAVEPIEDSRYSTFTLFPKLPLELRRKIWVDSFPRARIVDLLTYEELHDPIKNIGMYEETRIMANKHARDRFPVTLSVNRESRTETLR